MYVNRCRLGSFPKYQALTFGTLGIILDKQVGSTEADCLVNWGLVGTMCILVTSYTSQRSAVFNKQE